MRLYATFLSCFSSFLSWLSKCETWVINIKRKLQNNKILVLPYLITYHYSKDEKDNTNISLSWLPHYRAEGQIVYKNNESRIALYDTNGDGNFNDLDFQATNIAIDMNKDGRFYGSEEWFWGEKVVKYSNNNFVVEKILLDGSSIIFRETDIEIPHVGEKIPYFDFTTKDGKKISSKDLKGRIYILDFWASWCNPCVKKFTIVQQLNNDLKGKIQFYLINIDKSSRIKYAEEVIEKYNLKFPHVMNGLGTNEPLWRMFGSMKEWKFGIPLYILVDSKSKIIYAGNGGRNNLSELQQKLKDIIN